MTRQNDEKISVRYWFGTKPTDIKISEFARRAKKNYLTCEFVKAGKQVKLHFDFDFHMPTKDENLVKKYNVLTNEFVAVVYKLFDTNEHIKIDFSRQMKDEYKLSYHIVFNKLDLDYKYYGDAMKQKMFILFKSEAFKLMVDGKSQGFDENIFRNASMFRNWLIAKPIGKHVKGSFDDKRDMSSRGIFKHYIGDELKTEKKKFNTNLFKKSLIQNINPESVNINEKLDKIFAEYVEDKTVSKKLKKIKKDGERYTVKLNAKYDEFLKNSKKYHLTLPIKILYLLPEPYAHYTLRNEIVPYIKQMEHEMDIKSGDLFMNWIHSIRTNFKSHDYKEAYLNLEFIHNPNMDVLEHFNFLKEKNEIFYYDEKIIMDSQANFRKRSVRSEFTDYIEFYQYLVKTKDQKINKKKLEMIFSHMSIIHFEGYLLILKCRNKAGKTYYQKLQIGKEKNLYTEGLLLNVGFNKKGEKIYNYTSIERKYAHYLNLFVSRQDTETVWGDEMSNPINFNINPEPSYSIPKKEDLDMKKYENFVEKFKFYIMNVFLRDEDKNIYNIFLSHYRSLLLDDFQMEKILILTGSKGTGKSLLYERIFTKILGQEYISISNQGLNTLTDNFTAFNANTRLLLFEEASTYKKSNLDAAETLKALATQKTIEINEKYIQKYKVKNLMNIVIISNNPHPILTNMESRRIIRIKTSDEYFKDAKDKQIKTADFYDLMMDNIPEFIYYLTTFDKFDDYKKLTIETNGLKSESQYSESFSNKLTDKVIDFLTNRSYGVSSLTTKDKMLRISQADMKNIQKRQISLFKPGLLGEGWVFYKRETFMNYAGEKERKASYSICIDKLVRYELNDLLDENIFDNTEKLPTDKEVEELLDDDFDF